MMNRMREGTTSIRITDQGCMLRGYHRSVIEAINRCIEVSTYVPALAYTFARHPVEIEVAHAERTVGQSKYSLYRLIRLNFDLMTGFSVAPLQFFTMAGRRIALISLVFVVVLPIRRLIVGPEVEGLFTLFGIAFFLIGVPLVGLGVVGEYVGRIYEQVRQRPRYTVAAVLEEGSAAGWRAAAGAAPPQLPAPLPQRRACAERRVSPARAVVFAYHDVGVRCLKALLSGGSRCRWSSPSRTTRTRRSGLRASPRPRQRLRPDRDRTGRRQHAGARAHGRRASARTSSSPSTTARCSARRCCAARACGALNMHGSLLPNYRGRAPGQLGDPQRASARRGATLHYMVERADAGDIVDQLAVPILEDDDAREVFAKVTVAAETCWRARCRGSSRARAPRRPQPLEPEQYFGRRTPGGWPHRLARPARQIHDLVRAVAPPFPGAFARGGRRALADPSHAPHGRARRARDGAATVR